MMPIMDGFEFLVALRAEPKWHNLPVVVVTAKDLSESERALLNSQVQNVIEKGAYSRDQLLTMVRSALADSHNVSSPPPTD
jgi:CheY-like chemotaxis protein